MTRVRTVADDQFTDELPSGIREPLADLRARIQAHGGDVRARATEEGDLEVRFLGACQGCVALPLTFLGVVRPRLKEALPTGRVICSQVSVSPHAMDRISSLLSTPSGGGSSELPARPGGVADTAHTHGVTEDAAARTSPQPPAAE
jgi:Fe-S cluster biogenesis protein NfuA